MEDLDGFGAMHPAAVRVVFRKNYALGRNQWYPVPAPNTPPSAAVPYHGLLDFVSEPVAMKPSVPVKLSRTISFKHHPRFAADAERKVTLDSDHHESTHKAAGVV